MGPGANTSKLAPEPAAEEEATQTFPAHEVFWGFVVRGGTDELDDPHLQEGVTQHGYLGGDDRVAICGFRPPLTGLRSRRHVRLGMPRDDVHPKCATCARSVVASRPTVTDPVAPDRPVAPGGGHAGE